jgi:SAM-dependent methyltransferase
MDFYTETIDHLLSSGKMSKTDRLLVVCAGGRDAKALLSSGCTNVTISNLAERWDMAGVSWIRQDAEEMSFEDESFDWVAVHAGLHHCASPHAALLEMYRVARKGVLVIEARESALMRAAVRFGFVPEFELEAVVLEGWNSGGVRNSPVPNYIYRWTEREVMKTIESAHPEYVHNIEYRYGVSFPEGRIARTPLRKLAWLLRAVAHAVHAVFPKQGNNFGFIIEKSHTLKPWIAPSGDRMRRDYKLRFDGSRRLTPSS